MSKSTGNVVDPLDLVARFGQDAVRYYLLAELSPFADGDFTEEALVGRYNADLANGLGNMVSRVTAMTVRYRGGTVPPAGPGGEPEAALQEQLERSAAQAAAAMDRYDHREALARVWDAVRRANAYIDERAPWHLARAADGGDQEAAALLDTTLNRCVHAIRDIAVLLSPFVPAASGRILDALGLDAGAPGGDLTGRPVSKAPPLFPRLELD